MRFRTLPQSGEMNRHGERECACECVHVCVWSSTCRTQSRAHATSRGVSGENTRQLLGWSGSRTHAHARSWRSSRQAGSLAGSPWPFLARAAGTRALTALTRLAIKLALQVRHSHTDMIMRQHVTLVANGLYLIYSFKTRLCSLTFPPFLLLSLTCKFCIHRIGLKNLSPLWECFPWFLLGNDTPSFMKTAPEGHLRVEP